MGFAYGGLANLAGLGQVASQQAQKNAMFDRMMQAGLGTSNIIVRDCTFSGNEEPRAIRPKTLRDELQTEVDAWLPKLC